MALQQHVDVRPEQLLLARCSLASKELLIAGLWEECRVRSVEATRALIRKVLFVLVFFFASGEDKAGYSVFAIFSNFSLLLEGISAPVIETWLITLQCRNHSDMIFINTQNDVFLSQLKQFS